MPIAAPTTLSHPLLSYLLTRTQFTLTPVAGGVGGLLADATGMAVADAPVAVEAVGLAATQAVPVLQAVGAVPANASTALVMLRVNADCNCAGQEDALFGNAQYSEAGAGTTPTAIGFATLAGKPSNPAVAVLRPTLRLGQPLVEIIASPAQAFSNNTRPFPVTPGAAFTLSVPAASISGHALDGSVGIVFFDGSGKSAGKATLKVPMPVTQAGGVLTDANGRFTVPPPAAGGATTLRLIFPGSATLRGATANVP
jgi:hypothetical protein